MSALGCCPDAGCAKVSKQTRRGISEPMKQVIITNDQGNPLFCLEGSGHRQCLVLSALQQFLATNFFGASLRYMRAGHVHLLLLFRDNLWYAMASDEEESRQLLHQQLSTIADIFVMKFGQQMLQNLFLHKQLSLTAYQPALGQLFSTYFRLFKQQQSFLVQAIESLHVNGALQHRCESALRDANTACAVTGVHCLLFVGVKLVARYAPTGAVAIADDELLKLLVFMEALCGNDETLNEQSQEAGDHNESNSHEMIGSETLSDDDSFLGSNNSTSSQQLIGDSIYLRYDSKPHSVCFARIAHRITLMCVCAGVVCSFINTTITCLF